MTNKEKAIQWAENFIINNNEHKPIKLSSFETVSNPTEFLKVQIQRMLYASLTEQKLAYKRVKLLKDNYGKK